MELTVIPFVIGVLGTIPKSFLRVMKDLVIGGQAKTTQTTIMLRSARILRILFFDPKKLAVTQTSMKNVGVKNS